MTFKEQIARDNLTVFMNLDEFSEIHMVNGLTGKSVTSTNEVCMQTVFI